MRTSILCLVFCAVVGWASPAHASPVAPTPRLPVAADVVVEYPRPYGYRWTGGYYRTEYRWVCFAGAVTHVDAFGREYRLPGHCEQRPFQVWVPYRVLYARPYTRSVTGGLYLGSGYRGH